MSKRDELIQKYADAMTKMGLTPDMDLLKRAVIACGPSVYSADSETVAASDQAELDRVKQNFIGKRLGVTDAAKADAAMNAAVEKIGKSNRNKYRAVMYYLIAQELGATAKL